MLKILYNLDFFGYLPNPATKLQLIIEVLNYNTIIVDAVIVTLLLWLLYVIVLVGNILKNNVDEPVFWYITSNILSKGVKFFKLEENKILEFIWTIIPGVIILGIMIPSIIGSYVSEVVTSSLTPIKIIGNQWFWTSEHTILAEEKIIILEGLHLLKDENSVFLLVTEKPIVVPIFNRIPFIVTSNDVIHSFALPECGIKIDALPGRLNQVFAEFIRVGNYTGMCSELCGVGHAKMPINVIAMSNEGYIQYTKIFNPNMTDTIDNVEDILPIEDLLAEQSRADINDFITLYTSNNKSRYEEIYEITKHLEIR